MSRERIDAFQAAASNDWFGFRFASWNAKETEVSMPVEEHHLQVDRVVHGGVLTTLADTAAAFLLYPQITGPPASIELSLHCLRPAVRGEADLVARARPVRLGRNVAVVDVEVTQAARQVAAGRFSYFVGGRAGP